MSFSVDLWNGFDPIKVQYSSIRNKMKAFYKLLSSYTSIESIYCKSIENLFKEFKEYKENKENVTNSGFLIDTSFNKIIEMFEYENEKRKSYYNDINKMILEPLNAFLESPRIKISKYYSDNNENVENFNKSINTLIDKQTIFHSYCKELTLAIAQDEMVNVHKSQKSKSQKLLEKVKDYKEDYINCIKETNISRENYNSATEKILETIESMFKELVDKFKEYLVTFTSKRNALLKCLIGKEEEDFKEIHSKIDTNTEIINFIMRNATKEFPMIKIEFLPIKYNVLEKYVKSKNKYQEKDFLRIKDAIKNYFELHNIFKDDDLSIKNKKPNDITSRRFTFFNKKSQISINNSNKSENKIQENKTFIENYLNDLFNLKNEEELKENKIAKSKENKENPDIKNDNNNNKDSNQKDKDKPKENSSNENKEKANINKDEISDEKKENNSVQNKDNNISENQDDKNKENATKKEENNNMNSENTDIKENKGLEGIEDIARLIFNQTEENHLFYIEVIIKKLSYLRSRGNFEVDEGAYNILISLFDSISKQNPKNDYILKNIIILAHTFYRLENGQKIYLQEGLKGRKIFNTSETWHRAINYSMNLSSSDKDIVNYRKNVNEIKEKINKESQVTIPAYLMDVRFFANDPQVYYAVRNYYVKVYNLDQDLICHQEESYRKAHPEITEVKKTNEKLDMIDINKGINDKKDNAIITINDIITNNNLDIQSSLNSTIKDSNSFKIKLNNKNENENIKIEKVSNFEFIPNNNKNKGNNEDKNENENKSEEKNSESIEENGEIIILNDYEEKKNITNEVNDKDKDKNIVSNIENKDNNIDINNKPNNDNNENKKIRIKININKNQIKTNNDSSRNKINLNQIEYNEFVIVEKYNDDDIKKKKEETNTDKDMTMTKENIKNEINIIKPQNYNQLLSILRNSIKELPEFFYLFYTNEKNEEIKIYNNEQYKFCKDILLIREIKGNQLQSSIFSLNYNILSESKKEILDDKYGCNICNIIIKKEKPLFCYRCQKLFHQKCLLDWDQKKKILNQELSCPNCNKKLPISQWEKKLDFEDERMNEANLLDKVINNELNKKINDKINKMKFNQLEEFKKEKNHIYKKYNDLMNISKLFLKSFKEILVKINEINSLINKSIDIKLEYLYNNISLESIETLYKSIINQLNIIKNEIKKIKKNNNNETNKKLNNKNNEKKNEQNKDIILQILKSNII